MGKVLLIAAIAVTAVTAALGFLNKTKLSDATGKLTEAAQQVQQKTTAAEKAEGELKTAKDSLTTASAEKEQAIAQADAVKADMEKNVSQLTEATTKLGTMEGDIAKLQADIVAKEEELKTAREGQPAVAAEPTDEMKKQMEEKELLITKLQGDLEGSRTQLEVLKKEKADRMALKMRNGLEGRVLAVNQAWNFVVLNLGDRNGVIGNAEMLIKRGSTLIGKVRVTSVEPSTSVADIVSKSVPTGMTIQPGDNVIYQAVEE